MKSVSKKMAVAIVAMFALANLAFANVNAKTDPINKNPKVEKSVEKEEVKQQLEIEKKYQLVKVSGNFKVYLSQGNEQKIVVEGEESVLPEVKHFVVDNTLTIYTTEKVRKRLTLYVTLKDIDNFNEHGHVRVIRQ